MSDTWRGGVDLSARGPRLRGWAPAALLLFAWSGLAAADPGDAPPSVPPAYRRVLILSSFAGDFGFFNDIRSAVATELAREWSGRVDIYEMPLDLARFESEERQAPYVGYLAALFASRRLDLVITLGGPASRFAQVYRESAFAGVPVLHGAVERRLLDTAVLGRGDATVPVEVDLGEPVEVALRLLPETENLAIVLGSSPLEIFWRVALEGELARHAGRLRLIWLDGLSLEQVRERLGALPPRSAVYFFTCLVDGAGVPHSQEQALAVVHQAANAPVFGLFESQLGRGVVGGRLLPVTAIGHRVAEAAIRLLRGTAPSAVRDPPLRATEWTFDARELERWRIPAERLPPGSTLRFEPRSPFTRYRWQILGGLALLALQALLIGVLLLHRARRRSAEDEVRSLHGRLLSTYEQERRRLARELHDDVTQRLARLVIDGAQVERLGATPAGTETLRQMRAELVRLGRDVHDLSRRLHPSILDDLGLVEAMRAEGDRLAHAGTVAVEYRFGGLPREIPADTGLCLFRAAQEALRNVEQHARATRVLLALESAPGGVELTVRDDGVGYDAEMPRSRSGLGQVSMRERLNLIGGRLSIESEPGSGTMVRAWAPLPGDSA